MHAETGPAARSTLGATPLLHVLISLLAKKASGSLVVDSSDQRRLILVLLDGVPQKINCSVPVARLSELLVNLGRVNPEAAEDTFGAAQTVGQLHGQLLLSKNLVDHDTLEIALRAQVPLKLGWASTLPAESTVDFDEGADFLDTLAFCPLFNSPMEVVWATARSHVDLKSVAAVLRQLVNRPLRLHPMSQPEWFGFDSLEWSVIEQLTAGVPNMQDLIQQVSVPIRTVQIMLYVLTITRQIDLGQRKPPIGFWANPTGIRPAARLPSSISMRAVKATEAAHRSAEMVAVTVPPPTHEGQRVERALDAMHSLKRAEFLLQHRRFDEAEAEAKLALEHDPAQPECRALHAWIQVCRAGGSIDLQKMLAIISDALEKNPVNETIRFRRAQLLSRLGHTDEALREYQLIVELNPGHVDAMREIRLWELRSRDKRSSKSGQYLFALGPRASERPQPPGIFSRFFRK